MTRGRALSGSRLLPEPTSLSAWSLRVVKSLIWVTGTNTDNILVASHKYGMRQKLTVVHIEDNAIINK